MDSDTMFTLILIYIAGLPLFAMLFGDECEGYEIVLWPLTVAKYLLRGMYLILFTGWRP